MSILQALQNRQERAGIVERSGPWFGTAQACGVALLLRDDPTVYVVLRDDQLCEFPAGLTQPGDEVSFLVSPHGSVKLSSFRNVTLQALLDRHPQK